jgi:hypothetical protein
VVIFFAPKLQAKRVKGADVHLFQSFFIIDSSDGVAEAQPACRHRWENEHKQCGFRVFAGG